MMTLTPVQYLNWLTGIKGMREQQAVEHIERLYEKQTGEEIKLVLVYKKSGAVWECYHPSSNVENGPAN